MYCTMTVRVTCEETHDSSNSKSRDNNGLTRSNCYIRTMTWQREVIQMTWQKWHGKCHDESDMGNVMTKVTWGLSRWKWHEKCHKMWHERRRRTSLDCQSFKQPCWCTAMKVIRHAGVDSRMIILDDQARQQMTHPFQLSLQCNVSPITGCVPDEAHFFVVLDCPK